MKSELIIQIGGETGSGKSRLCFLLKKFLHQEGFKVNFDGGIDFKNEKHFDQTMQQNFDKIIEKIKNTRTIEIKEAQLKHK